MNLLDITQEILNEMDGDVVNSIFDTEESEQVANIVRSTFRAMASNSNWPSHRRLTKVVPSTDSATPTHMTLASDVKEVVSIHYNTAKDGVTRREYTQMEYLQPEQFMMKTNSRNSDSANTVVVVDSTGVELLITNNKAPSYFTSFDDTTLVFDSFDSVVDSTLQASKVQTIAYLLVELALSDSAVPDLPPDALTALVEESKSRCQSKIRQFNDVKSEQEAQRQRRYMSRKNWRANGGIQYANYGRNSNVRRDPTFRNGDQ